MCQVHRVGSSLIMKITLAYLFFTLLLYSLIVLVYYMISGCVSGAPCWLFPDHEDHPGLPISFLFLYDLWLCVSGAPCWLLPDHEDHACLPLLHHAALQSHRVRAHRSRVRQRQRYLSDHIVYCSHKGGIREGGGGVVSRYDNRQKKHTHEGTNIVLKGGKSGLFCQFLPISMLLIRNRIPNMDPDPNPGHPNQCGAMQIRIYNTASNVKILV